MTLYPIYELFLKFKAAIYAIDVKTISDTSDDKPSGAP